jgi:hypothetical protein
LRLRNLVVFCYDLLAAGAAWCAAFWLRFNLDIPGEYAELMGGLLPSVMVIYGTAFWLLGIYRGLWRYASLPIYAAFSWRWQSPHLQYRRPLHFCASASRSREPPTC